MPEMTSIIIAGLAMWITELAKRKGMNKFYVPVAAFGVAGAVTVAWYAVFDPAVAWQNALKDGFALGAVAGGLYGFGQTFIGRKTETEYVKNEGTE